MKISIYIPVFNQRDELARTLRALIPEKDGHEVFVVDLGSTDGSLDVPKEHAWVTVVKPESRRLSSALNEAAAQGGGEVMFYLRPGSIPARGWSAVLEEKLGKELDAGHFHLREADAPFAWAAAVRALAQKVGCSLLGGPAGLNGVAVKRSAFDEVEGFRPVPDFEWLAFANRLRRSGAAVKAIGHEVLVAPAPGAGHVDAWRELKDDFLAAWRYRKTENFDPVRTRRKTSAAVLFGHDIFEGDSAGDYYDYARDEVLRLSLEMMQSYRGVERIFFLGGARTTRRIGQPSGVEVVGKTSTGVEKRFAELLDRLKREKIDGLLLVRGISGDLSHTKLREACESDLEAPCVVLPEEGTDEWLALWFESDALKELDGWEIGPEINPLRAFLKTRAVRLEEESGIPALRTDSDARALYYAGVLDRVPA